METVLVVFFVFVIGLCIGSFLNVVILRAFSEESIILPASKCPECKNKIRWHDNIPLLSYIILKGKCRDCGTKISLQYPIIEFLAGFLFVLLVMHFGLSVYTMFLCVLTALGIVISTTDIKEKVVFDVHTILFIVAAIVCNVVTGSIPILTSVLGLIFAGLVMEATARLGYVFIKKRAFGEGDTLIAAGIGALLGFKLFMLVLALAIIFQVLFILPSFLKKMWDNGEKRLVISLITFIFFVFIYKIAGIFIEYPLIIVAAFILIIVIAGIYCCIRLINITKATENITYLPFGPSLLSMTFVVLLWGSYIVEILRKIYA